MQKRRGIETVHRVLEPTIPIDVGIRSQRQRIIDAMIGSCAEKTYAATTIADIVGRASISRTTFYKRFAGKKECFDAALDWCIEEIRTTATNSYSVADSPPEAVRKATAAVLELMAERPDLAQLTMGEAVVVEPAIVGRYHAILAPAIATLWPTAPKRSHTDPKLAFGRAQVLIYNQVIAGKTKELPDLLPQIVYTLLLPFAGHDEAMEQARVADSDLSQLGGR